MGTPTPESRISSVMTRNRMSSKTWNWTKNWTRNWRRHRRRNEASGNASAQCRTTQP